MARSRGRLAALVGAAALLAASCVPEPSPPPPPPPPPPPAPAPAPFALPAAFVGSHTGALDPRDAPDPFVLAVDPVHCVTAAQPAPPPTTTTTTTSPTPNTTTPTIPTTTPTTSPAPPVSTTVPTPGSTDPTAPTTTSTTTTTTTTTTSPPPTTPTTAPVPVTVPPAPAPPPPLPEACYFAYTTQVGWLLVPLWYSTDLQSWQIVEAVHGSAMPELAPWVRFGFSWAPSVLERPANPPESRFVMWYTARHAGTTRQCLGVATAASPLGPFVDHSTEPAYCQVAEGGTIDASPFVDDDGTAYLVYKSEFPARLWASRLAADGKRLVPGTEHFLWAPYVVSDDPVVEGPTMVRANGRVYLMYSTGDWESRSYRVGVAHCDAPTGPCFAMYSSAVLASRGSMLGPGGQTPFRDRAGRWHLMFHAWTAPSVGYPDGARSLHLLPLSFAGNAVRVG